MTMPNFLIIGAAKSGTTALYAYLKQHPDIFMSPVKEPRFFAFEGEHLSFNGPGDHGEKCSEATITDLKTYQSLFKNVTTEKAIGEASPAYLSSAEKASERIRYYLPEVKLIAILRQPAERAYSAFLHTVKSGYESSLSFEAALALEEKRIQENWESIWHHKQLGYYYEQLKPYFNRFPKEQIRVYLFDDLKGNGSSLVKNIFSFLEVDDSFSPDTSEKVNVSGVPRSLWLHDFLSKNNDPIKDLLKPLFPKKLRNQLVKKMKHSNLQKPQLSYATRQELNQLYREDILKLQDLIGRDLTSWLS